MAAALETQAQIQRDLRSARTDFKRAKDSNVKWSFGTRPLTGIRLDIITGQPMNGTETQWSKSRPMQKNSDASHYNRDKPRHNMVKTTRGNWDMPSGLVRVRSSAQEELDHGTQSEPFDHSRVYPVHDEFLYNFDTAGSPATGLSLDVFVKSNPRAMEKLVEKEYEVLDVNGDALKGKKARQHLRQKAASDPGVEKSTLEEDGFELV